MIDLAPLYGSRKTGFMYHPTGSACMECAIALFIANMSILVSVVPPCATHMIAFMKILVPFATQTLKMMRLEITVLARQIEAVTFLGRTVEFNRL
eukprot:c37191_g1_i1 orf=257-541(-)